MIQSLTKKINNPVRVVFWITLIFLSGYFYYDNAVVYLFGYRNPRFDAHQLWFVLHMAGATCSLFLGPVQFWKFIRTKYIRFHRIAGKIYIIGSLIAAAGAFRLAFSFTCVGCRYSLIPLSVLFFLTTALAWYAIRKKNVKAHKQFMVRSYVCALAFVFVRLYQVLPLDFIFQPITSGEVFSVVVEWTFSILPLILVEIVMTWIPSIQSNVKPV